MANFPDGCIDLICLDPPFNSKRQYNQIFKNSGLRNDPQIKAFDDMWLWDAESAERVARVKRASANPASKVIAGFELHIPKSEMLSYTSYMAERLFVMHRIIKDTGSIYLHCDPTASHYLKLVMDAIFGKQNFRNEIVWHYRTYQGKVKEYYPRKHDFIYWYTKDKTEFDEKYDFELEYMDNYEDTVDYKRWKNFYVNKNEIVYGQHPKTDSRFTAYLDRWILKNGRRPKIGETIYQCKGYVVDDVWVDIQALDPKDKTERLGYPTQKPTALYERIVNASSNPDDLVLDPFAGCGTTIEAALKNDRRVIGIDILPFALHLINKYRVAPYAPKLQNPDKLLPMKGVPVDYDTASALVDSDPFKFQDWAVSLVHGFASNPKKVGDDGIDGYGALLNKPDNMDRQGILVQVTGAKGSQKGKYDRLHANVRNENAAMGVLITLDAQPASRNWTHTLDPIVMGETTYPPIQCFSIEEYFSLSEDRDRLLRLPPLANPWTGKAMLDVQTTLL